MISCSLGVPRNFLIGTAMICRGLAFLDLDCPVK